MTIEVKKMPTKTMQIAGRILGYIYLVGSVLFTIGLFFLLQKRTNSGSLHVIFYELAFGDWGNRLLCLSVALNSGILSYGCFRLVDGRSIRLAIATFVGIAIQSLVVIAVATLAIKGVEEIRVTPVRKSFTVSIVVPPFSWNRFVRPAIIYGVVLLPILLLQRTTKSTSGQVQSDFLIDS